MPRTSSRSRCLRRATHPAPPIFERSSIFLLDQADGLCQAQGDRIWTRTPIVDGELQAAGGATLDEVGNDRFPHRTEASSRGVDVALAFRIVQQPLNQNSQI